MNPYYDAAMGPRRNSLRAQSMAGEYGRSRGYGDSRHSMMGPRPSSRENLTQMFDEMFNRQAGRGREYGQSRQRSQRPVYEEVRPWYQQRQGRRRGSLFEQRLRGPSIQQGLFAGQGYGGDARDRLQPLNDIRAGLVNAQFGSQAQGLRRDAGRRQVGRCLVPGYTFVKSLTPGGMSQAITVIEDNRSGKLYVEKRIGVNQNPHISKRVEAEIYALKIARGGPNLNQLVTFLDQPPNVAIILEYCDQGSLEDKLTDRICRGSLFEERYIWHVFLGVAQALAFLHFGIRQPGGRSASRWDTTCHLDIKPCNVFLSSTGVRGSMPRIVLGDFGCAVAESSVRSGSQSLYQQGCGTPDWYPPEGLEQVMGRANTRYGPETDIWQLGAMIHTLCRLIRRPDKRMVPGRNACGSAYGANLNYEVEKCCAEDWRHRPTASRLLSKVENIMRSKGMST